MDLTTLDLFLFYHDLEPSKIKLWEFVRRYNPLHFSALLYMLENVTRNNSDSTPLDVAARNSLYAANQWNTDVRLVLSPTPRLNLDRGERDETSLYLEIPDQPSVIRRDLGDLRDNRDVYVDTLQLLELIKRGQAVPAERTLLQEMLCNMGTARYRALAASLSYLLFSDALQNDRESKLVRKSLMLGYLQYYKMMVLREPYVIDPRKFRYFIVPRAERTHARPSNDLEYAYQPLYNGIHLVVNCSGAKDTRSFNRYGEYQRQLLWGERFSHDCTLEAVLLPLDDKGRPRSWHYWEHRSSYRLFVVDVLRFEDNLLTSCPFVERLKYRDMITSDRSVLAEVSSWEDVSRENRKTMYHHISGIMIRRKLALPNEPPKAYKFPTTMAFDLYNHEFVEITDAVAAARNERDFAMHYMLETASHRTVCLVYAHTNTEFFMCSYNDGLHQFEHVATMTRAEYDIAPIAYRDEKIMVVNAKAIPMGVFYLRVYYDKFGEIYGYENKLTTGKHDLPLTNRLYALLGKGGNDCTPA